MKFLIWLGVGVVLFLIYPSAGIWYVIISGIIWGASGEMEKSTKSNTASPQKDSGEDFSVYDRVYANGEKRVEKMSKTGYIYSDGTESWIDILGAEHRSNGEIVRENAYIPGKRDIYNENGECIGHEYEDSTGITHRYK